MVYDEVYLFGNLFVEILAINNISTSGSLANLNWETDRSRRCIQMGQVHNYLHRDGHGVK